MISINKVDHINLSVKNLDRSIKFYSDIFGFKLRERAIRNGSDYAIIGLSNKLFLCLYESNFNKSNMNHFGIHIENFREALQLLKENGIELLYGGLVQYPQSQSIYISDPSGNEIELSNKFGGLE